MKTLGFIKMLMVAIILTMLNISCDSSGNSSNEESSKISEEEISEEEPEVEQSFFDKLTGVKDYSKVEAFNQELISKKISKGDFMGAYTILDSRRVGDKVKTNEKILRNEIATLISESEGASAFPQIVFAIKERSGKNTEFSGEYYHGEWYHVRDYGENYAFKLAECDMYDFAIEIADAVDNQALVTKLKKAKPTIKSIKKKK